MAEDNRLYELIGEMLIEQRNTNNVLRQLRGDFTLIRDDFNTRLGRLEEEQKKTNVLLQQHTRDLMKIAQLLDERVVHWGDNATLRSGRKKVVGVIERTAQ
jgi:hypothetical protein